MVQFAAIWCQTKHFMELSADTITHESAMTFCVTHTGTAYELRVFTRKPYSYTRTDGLALVSMANAG